jgi:uncharacterized damage-inducible protein DinB
MSFLVVEDLQDPRRSEPDFLLPERTMLEGWLDFHRATLLLKSERLNPERLKLRPVPTSKLSLHGIVRHMAEVERGWFRRVLQREPDAPHLWRTPSNDEADLMPLDRADWAHDLAAWEQECEASRHAASSRTLDDTGLRHGRPCSLRWIYVHMIEEYARHNGHADLIRELVDGAIGW